MNFNQQEQEMYKSAFVKKLMENYDPYIQAVAKNSNTGLTDERAAKLAVMLSNTEMAMAKAYRRLNESTQVPDVGGEFKKHSMALISATFPNLIAEELVSVQPLQMKIGQIFFLKYLYGSNKGKIKAGDVAFDRFGATRPDGFTNYTSEIVDEEILVSGDGTSQLDANLSYLPVRPGTVELRISDLVTLKDNGQGQLIGAGKTATIDYNSGRITSNEVPADGFDVEATYEFNNEHAPATTIPELNLRVEETTVKARSRKLKTLYSFDSGYDLSMTHGINIDEALNEAAVQSIKNEIDGEVMQDLYNGAGLTSTWNKHYDSSVNTGETLRDHYLTFIDEIISAGNAMFTATRRIKPNFLIVGKWGADVLQSIGAPRFVGAGVINPEGPHFMGTLDNSIRVYHNPYYAQNQYLLGHKGTTLLDAGYAYCPYLPIMNTQLLMMEDFTGRKGYATSYGKKMLMSNSYIKGLITNDATR